jgi:hypothetical protein
MGAQAAGEGTAVAAATMTSTNGGQRFDDVIQVELEFLLRDATKAD